MEIPEDLTSLEYARNFLELTLGWPARGNLEMMADCITSVSKAKRLTLPQALIYLERAVKLAKEQSIKVDRYFFMDGEYLNIRPTAKNQVPIFKPEDRTQIDAHQATKEWMETAQELRETIKRLAGLKSMEAK